MLGPTVKAFLQYLLLVGIPVLGVVGILQLGQSLTAPKAVSGRWAIASDRPEATIAARACAATDVTTLKTFAIAQSGPRLTLELGEIRAHGLVEGEVVQAESGQVAFDARLERSGVMRGTLRFPACPDTPGLAFTATPEAAS